MYVSVGIMTWRCLEEVKNLLSVWPLIDIIIDALIFLYIKLIYIWFDNLVYKITKYIILYIIPNN